MSDWHKGTQKPSSKLDERWAAEIYYSQESSFTIAPKYGVSPGLVRRLRRRGRWGNWRAPHGSRAGS